jgi:hypothetical protein
MKRWHESWPEYRKVGLGECSVCGRNPQTSSHGAGNYWHGSSRLARYLMYLVSLYESVSKSVRTGRLERELQMVQLSATGCNCIAILWVSLVSFFRHNPSCCFSTSVYYCCLFIYPVRKLLDTPCGSPSSADDGHLGDSRLRILSRLLTGRPVFDSQQGWVIFVFTTAPGAHPASYPMSAGGFFPR